MDRAHRRYVIRTWAFMVPYVLFNAAAIRGAFDVRNPAASWVLGLAVAAPIVGQMWATLALMRDSDEYVRALMAKRFIVAASATFAIATAWGLQEEYAQAMHISGVMVYPLFWACFAIAAPFLRTTR